MEMGTQTRSKGNSGASLRFCQIQTYTIECQTSQKQTQAADNEVFCVQFQYTAGVRKFEVKIKFKQYTLNKLNDKSSNFNSIFVISNLIN